MMLSSRRYMLVGAHVCTRARQTDGDWDCPVLPTLKVAKYDDHDVHVQEESSRLLQCWLLYTQ